MVHNEGPPLTPHRSEAASLLAAKSRRSLVLDNLLESVIIYPRPVISSP